MTNTLIGVFDDRTEAQRAEQELIAAGFDRSAVSVRAGQTQATTTTTTKTRGRDDDGGGVWEAIKDLFGMADDSERAYYQEAARRGGVILSVNAQENQIDRACDILQRHNPVDIETRAQQWRQQGWTPPATADMEARITTQHQQQPQQHQRQPAQRRRSKHEKQIGAFSERRAYSSPFSFARGRAGIGMGIEL
jgi:hypothetical protein